MLTIDRDAIRLIELTVGFLALAGVTGAILRKRAKTPKARAKAANFNTRALAWVVMIFVFTVALAMGKAATFALFGMISFQALREFVTLSPTRRGDHHALFWVFFVMTPLQYGLLAEGMVGIALIMIPVYGFLFLSLRSVLAGDCRAYLERTAKIYWAAMICVYSVSAAPALLELSIPGTRGREWHLLVFLLVMAETDDVFQYLWGNAIGRHKLAPKVSPNKTWEGFAGGVLTVTALGAAMSWLTPFTWWQSALFAMLIAICGTAGGLVMSAIKRDAGAKDYGSIIAGHGGVMDRIDSLTFAAPVFFHIVRYYFAIGL